MPMQEAASYYGCHDSHDSDPLPLAGTQRVNSMMVLEVIVNKGVLAEDHVATIMSSNIRRALH